MPNIRKIRKERGLTMKQLGELAGVTESAIGLYETNKRKPSYEVLLRLSEALECSVDDILGTNGKTPDTKASSVSDDDIKFALFHSGEDDNFEVTDEMYEEVLRFAQFVKQREREKGKS